MKQLLRITWAVVLVSAVMSCQSRTEVSQILSTPNTRKQIMDSIANNSAMSVEMMDAMLNNKNSIMMMHGNEQMAMMMTEYYDTMMKMMKDNPEMMQRMMTDMMVASANDTTMMSRMFKSIMDNDQMMGMMQNMYNKSKVGMKDEMMRHQ